ncbi:MAG TPA: NEW3 domain-containing protein [Terriglobales bacterium]
MLLSSTLAFAHNPAANETDQVAVAQWKPGAPQIQLQGQIEIVHQDFPDGHGKFVYTLKQTDGTRVPMHFVKNPLTHFLTGDHVMATGQQSSSGLILYSGGNVKNSGGAGSSSCTADSGQSCTTASSIPVPNTFGTQSLLVILLNFQDDNIEPYTVADAQSMYLGTVNKFIQENSYGQTSFSGDVVGWFTIPVSVTTCNPSQIATYAQQAATAAGVNLSNYARYVYAFPTDSACGGWAGSSTVGGHPSETWINWSNPGIQLIDHELGHAFGLWHSHTLDCGTTTICTSGTVDQYGDNMDTMGYPQGPSPHYNSFQKERLGWLNYGTSPSIQTVTSSGTYTIYPYEQAGPGPNALKVLQSTNPTTGAKTWYYLESRQAVGFDAFLIDGTCPQCYTQNQTSGILFRLGTDGDSNSSLLLAMTPANPPPGWFDDSLPIGQTYQDSTAGVTFTPTAVSSTGATVQITLNGSSCSSANPTVSLSPSQSQNVTSGTPVTFTITVMDSDTSSCSPTTFNIAAMLPFASGWAGTLSTATLSLSPGKSGSATVTVTSPTGTVDGSYNILASATNASAPSYAGSATAAYVINTAPLTVTLTTNQSSYLPGQTVGIDATLLYGTAPDVAAAVSVSVTNPNGKTATLSGTTGSNGVALLNYKLSKGAPAGTYQAHFGTAVSGAASVAGASTSFSVQ